ncbi:hypothetical protein OH77DRAFT_1543271, partial [Trametes cingulata]
GNEIIDHLSDILAKKCPELARAGIIRPYNATMSHPYRPSAMEAFRTAPPSSNATAGGLEETAREQCIRIMVCTDAAGMGCNVKDVDVVVQWKLPKTLSNFVQRAGRAARSPTRVGMAVLLVERSVYSTDLRAKAGHQAKHSGASQKRTKGPQAATGRVPKGYAKSHGINRGGTACQDAVPQLQPEEMPHLDPEADDEGLRAFVQTTTCRRDIWASVFESPRMLPDGVLCCDICHPSLFNRVRPGRVMVPVKSPKMRAKGKP